jgi:hypothetical protein
MSKTIFLENLTTDINDQLAAIDVNAYTHVELFQDQLPDDEVIGELNDYEKRLVLWPQILFEEMLEDNRANRNKDERLLDPAVRREIKQQTSLIKDRVKYLSEALSLSLITRFGVIPQPVIRSNFKVVFSKETDEDRKKFDKSLMQSAMAEFNSSLHGDQTTN